jgi:plasmid stability protein
MTDLTIPNLDEATLRALRARARSAGRSVEEEARELLSRGAGVGVDRAELLARADRIRAMTPTDVPQTDSTDLIREDTDRR